VKEHASKKRARERERESDTERSEKERDVRLRAVGDDARSCLRRREKILC